MKIVIEDGFSTIQKTGIGQYTLMIEKLIKKLNFNVVQLSPILLSKLKTKIFRRILYNLWFNSIFLIKLMLLKDEVLVICTNYSIPIFKLKKVRFIPVIHDLCAFKYPEYSSKIINNYEKSNIKNSIKNANKIITVSNTVKNEISKTFSYPLEKIFVINSSLTTGLMESKDVDFKILHNKYNIERKKYILSVATNNKRKNIQILIDTFKNISKKYQDLKLVLVGSNYKKPNNKNIIVTGYIADVELKCLYKNSFLYIFPSVYEGFGTPIIDAQSFGVPVLCSDIPVFREIGANSVEYFSIENNNLKEKLISLLNNKQQINMLAKLGTKNIKRFTLDRILKSIEDVIIYKE